MYNEAGYIKVANNNQPRSLVPTRIGEVGEGIDYLLKQLSELEERLHPILRPSFPKNEAEGPAMKSSEIVSSLAESLGSFNDRLRIARDRLEDIINRLDI